MHVFENRTINMAYFGDLYWGMASQQNSGTNKSERNIFQTNIMCVRSSTGIKIGDEAVDHKMPL